MKPPNGNCQPTTDLTSLIKRNASKLNLTGSGLDPIRLVTALAQNESALGTWNVPKYEPSYGPGGLYYKSSQLVRDLYRKWGALAACSWSSWQIMFVTAVELGFNGSPLDLWKDEIAIKWVIKLINERIIGRGAKTLEEIADAYNSGNFRDSIVPEKYIADLKRHYEEVHYG